MENVGGRPGRISILRKKIGKRPRGGDGVRRCSRTARIDRVPEAAFDVVTGEGGRNWRDGHGHALRRGGGELVGQFNGIHVVWT